MAVDPTHSLGMLEIPPHEIEMHNTPPHEIKMAAPPDGIERIATPSHRIEMPAALPQEIVLHVEDTQRDPQSAFDANIQDTRPTIAPISPTSCGAEQTSMPLASDPQNRRRCPQDTKPNPPCKAYGETNKDNGMPSSTTSPSVRTSRHPKKKCNENTS